MRKVVFAALLIAVIAGIVLLVVAGSDSTLVAESAPVAEAVKTVVPAAPVTADMSLPMPQGLTGDVDKGRIFFMSNCFTCHGVKGDGEGPRAYFITPPPRNFLLETSRQRLNRPVLFEAISNGRLGTNMPAWRRVLNDQEIANVAEFVFQNFISAAQGN